MFASRADGPPRARIALRAGMSEPTLDIAIREARVGDTTQIADLLCQLGHPITPEQFAERFARLDAEPRVWLFVAATRNRRAGLTGLRC
jgi:hypothetical protein